MTDTARNPVLRDAEPLTRRDLADREIVEALWRQAGRQRGATQSLFGVCEVYRAFEHRPAHQFELGTALDYFDILEVPEKRQSTAFRNEISSR